MSKPKYNYDRAQLETLARNCGIDPTGKTVQEIKNEEYAARRASGPYVDQHDMRLAECCDRIIKQLVADTAKRLAAEVFAKCR